MKQRLALRILAQLMGWSDQVAQREFAWLKLMSRLKYDSYQGYLAGVRFVESLVVWLEQIEASERQAAYDLVRRQLVFVSTLEMRRLVERFYPREVEPRLVKEAAVQCSMPPYLVWSNKAASQLVSNLRRKTLFIGLSDGARMDVFRRANTGLISNEQTVLAPLIDRDKWLDLGKELERDLPSDPSGAKPKFTHVYLIDDLTASGTTLIRYNAEKKLWKGKLKKFREAIGAARDALHDDFPLDAEFTLCVHHYIATQAALDGVKALCAQAAAELKEEWFPRIEFSCGLLLGPSATLASGDPFEAIAQKYYDDELENRHTAESGVKEMHFGYKSGRLTVILEHNTPNNSISLLWAETAGSNGKHAMRALFRRQTRHV